jgi:hypothetical protein
MIITGQTANREPSLRRIQPEMKKHVKNGLGGPQLDHFPDFSGTGLP